MNKNLKRIIRNPITEFFLGIVYELRRVKWPTMQEATRLTLIVLAVSIVFTLFMLALDSAFFWLRDKLLIS